MKFCVVWSVVSSNSDQAEKTLRRTKWIDLQAFSHPSVVTYYCFCRSSLLQVKVVLK